MRERRVEDVMSTAVVTLTANESLSLADDIMQLGRIRHMPVVDDDGLLVGVLSQRDLFRNALERMLGYGRHAQDKLLQGMRAKEVMHSEVATVGPEAPLEDAAALMMRQKIGCLVVVKHDAIVGILTESDFVKLAIEG